MKQKLVKIIGVIFIVILFFQNICYADLIGTEGTARIMEEYRKKQERQIFINQIKEILPIIMVIGIAIITLVIISFFALKKIAKNDNEENT